MLDRVDGDEQIKIQLKVTAAVDRLISARAHSFTPRKTRSKYVSELVLGDVAVGEFDLAGLAKRVQVIAQSPLMNDDDARFVALRIASEYFGIGQAEVAT